MLVDEAIVVTGLLSLFGELIGHSKVFASSVGFVGSLAGG